VVTVDFRLAVLFKLRLFPCSACVGTVEPRSLVEPLRKLIARVRGHYMMGAAVDVDMSERLLEVEVPKDNEGGKMRCYVPCKCGVSQPSVMERWLKEADFGVDDRLIIAVGSTSNTHGVPGLEHSFQLKVGSRRWSDESIMMNSLASLITDYS
jgi:NADH dehydrogenase